MAVKRIHHINFIVKDLEEGIRHYEKILGESIFETDELPQRGVLTARAKIGEQWIVLIQPINLDLVPGQHLQENGEGFFLMSFEVDNMEDAVSEMNDRGVSFVGSNDRKGLLNWWVRDIEKKDTLGEQFQICEERD